MDGNRFSELVAYKKAKIRDAIENLKDIVIFLKIRVPKRLRKIIESGDGESVGWVNSYGPICKSAKEQLAYLKLLEEAERWLDARTGGMERHIEEIKRQTQHKEDQLEREYALAKLQKGGNHGATNEVQKL